MGEVLVGLKVLPKDVDVNIDSLETEIKKRIGPSKIVREPIAFGLVALIVSIIIPDAEGYLQNVESKIREIDTVGEVEVIEVARTL